MRVLDDIIDDIYYLHLRQTSRVPSPKSVLIALRHYAVSSVPIHENWLGPSARAALGRIFTSPLWNLIGGLFWGRAPSPRTPPGATTRVGARRCRLQRHSHRRCC